MEVNDIQLNQYYPGGPAQQMLDWLATHLRIAGPTGATGPAGTSKPLKG